jgi:Uma2 family endonuclease
MATTTKLVTYEEWLTMPQVDNAIQEVVNGEIVTMPAPRALHGDVVEALADILKGQVDPATVRVRISVFGLIIRQNPLIMRIPDLALFYKSNVVVVDGYIHSAPELVVEVLSPANRRREREEKLRDYESLGVPEIWVLSPEGRTFEVLLLKEGKLTTVALLREGTLRPTQFPEVTIDIASVWDD